MSYRVLRTEKANRQLIELAVYIAEESGDYETAMGVIDKLEAAIASLREMPERGILPRTEALRRQGHRVLAVGPYLLAYRVDQNRSEVVVTAVIHAKQDYLRVLR